MSTLTIDIPKDADTPEIVAYLMRVAGVRWLATSYSIDDERGEIELYGPGGGYWHAVRRIDGRWETVHRTDPKRTDVS